MRLGSRKGITHNSLTYLLLTHLVMGEVRFVTSETKAEEAELGEAPCRGGSLFLPLREVRLARVRVRAMVG